MPGLRRAVAVLGAVTLLLSACTSGGSPAPTTTSAPGATTTVTAPDAETSTTGAFACRPGSELELLCRATELIRTRHLTPPSEAQLAAAAARGIRELDASAGGSPHGDLACTLPLPAFEPVCSALENVGGPIEDAEAAAITGMVRYTLDPYSAYLDPSVLAQQQEEQSGTIEGIGALVTSEDTTAANPQRTPCPAASSTCRIVIVAPIPGSPAEAAGIEAGDILVAVDGKDVTGWSLDDVTNVVRGPAGTPVTLYLMRGTLRKSFTIVRAAVEVPVTTSSLVDGHIGYLRLSLFTSNAGDKVRQALQSLLDAHADTFVLDLRDDPGGALQAAVSVASEFLAGGLVLRTEAPGATTPYPVEPGGLVTDPSLRVIVVVNRGSASASEVVAGALQEAGRATVVGESTFGKNTVQQEFSLPNGAALKLTIARWVTPGGHDFGGVGITPDRPGSFPVDLSPEEVSRRAVALATPAV